MPKEDESMNPAQTQIWQSKVVFIHDHPTDPKSAVIHVEAKIYIIAGKGLVVLGQTISIQTTIWHGPFGLVLHSLAAEQS